MLTEKNRAVAAAPVDRRANRVIEPRRRSRPPRQASRADRPEQPIDGCQREVNFIAAYLASELRGAERAGFARHLEACPDCTAFLQTYRKTIELTKDFLARRAPRLRAPRLSSRPTQRRPKRR